MWKSKQKSGKKNYNTKKVLKYIYAKKNLKKILQSEVNLQCQCVQIITLVNKNQLSVGKLKVTNG